MPQICHMLGDELGTGVAVLVHVRETATQVAAAKGDERKALLAQETDSLVILASANDENAVRPPAVDNAAVGFAFILAIRGLGRDQQVKVVPPGFIPDAGQQFAKERIGKARAVCWDDKGQGIGPLFLEVTSGDVRIIAHLFGRRTDPLAGTFGDVVIPGQSARHGSNREADLLGDVLECDCHAAAVGNGTFQNVLDALIL